MDLPVRARSIMLLDSYRFRTAFYASILLTLGSCSRSESPNDYDRYRSRECWYKNGFFEAQLVLYDLGEGNFTLDPVSILCNPQDFDLGFPRSFVVPFYPAKDSSLARQFGLKGKFISNQISPTPNISQAWRVFEYRGSAIVTFDSKKRLRLVGLAGGSLKEEGNALEAALSREFSSPKNLTS